MGGKRGEGEGIEPRDYITTRCAMISGSGWGFFLIIYSLQLAPYIFHLREDRSLGLFLISLIIYGRF
jgi:hypothetical protein